MNVIKQICQNVAVIDNSKVVEQGSILEIFSNPKTKTARDFIKSVSFSEIPDELQKKIDKLELDSSEGIVIKIGFVGKITAKPIISTLVKKFDVDANILYGNIDYIQDTPFGTLIIELKGNNGRTGKALEYLEELGVSVDVIRGSEHMEHH